MVKIISLDKIENNLTGFFGGLQRNSYVVVKKNGKTIAGIINAEEMEDFLDARDLSLQKQIRRSYREFKGGKAKPARILLQKITATGK
ncbi:MAG: hypothetical protein A3G49_02460 [Candidatus Sungbacteria bacterium RIFCSPLOWO2_12_FULL_41_11]|uniref:Antitoxin n=1 Tax=Candidatus Sungbacteria bacterium RIFCSPLOWO2_12_FULL_41_11 TaxID=1802286 RepID=A0A1G2LNV1_9BACT|nr:MAG: hypothetical protein UV01_C0004G0081 [Parcubacteria group bacterium GW2011_GWA2_42_14]OGZ98999.1 MAG: hypothetical protein A3D41_05255 [Candidatus Sungbacteria bacterium RIFCSPHIGHO2_02_FULL_41_12b]OHA13204.1 MAG: hypothetical protein A3G49_02460 [Candidatus Sungbacteria bacterium RIFCSPLOWO2_12_FULL_41_11]